MIVSPSPVPPKRRVVLDDTVADQRQGISADVGMGVGLGHATVGRPAGMGKARAPAELTAGHDPLQRFDFTDATAAI